jgi:hypothetical protein
VYTIYHYDLTLVNPLVRIESEYADTQLPKILLSLITSTRFLATILQIIHNHNAQTFAGLYALDAYMSGVQRVVKMLEFWPWFMGRYEVRGGIGAITVIRMLMDAITFWQAWTLPRVEQVVPEDDE